MIDATQTERSIIGAILVEGEPAMSALVGAGVDATWFSAGLNRDVFKVALDLFMAGKPVNLITVHDRIGPAVTSTELDDLVAAHTTLSYLSAHIRDFEGWRVFVKANARLQDGIDALNDATLDTIRDEIAKVRANLDDLRDNDADTRTLCEIGNALVDRWQSTEPVKDHIAWPVQELNSLMGQITDEYIFVAALESVGKTAFALNLMLTAARSGNMVSLASLESRREKIVQRLIAILGQVNTIALRNKTALESSYDSARRAAKQLDALPLRITDRPMNTDQLLAWAKYEKGQGSRLLIVDNMRHIRPAQRYNSPVEQFRDLSVRLKWIRDDTGLPLVVLHHLTDDLDVSWSKDIRRDADILLFMLENEDRSVKPTANNQWTETCIVDFDVKKNREGMRGFKVSAEFVKKYQTFIDKEDR